MNRASFLRRVIAFVFLGIFSLPSVVRSNSPLSEVALEDAGYPAWIDWRHGFITPII
jgi:hypothetical protein